MICTYSTGYKCCSQIVDSSSAGQTVSTFFSHICLSSHCCAIQRQFLTKVDIHVFLKNKLLICVVCIFVYLIKLPSTQLCLFCNNIQLNNQLHVLCQEGCHLALYKNICVSCANVELLLLCEKTACVH